MEALRRGEHAGAPHEVLDPRDVKYYRNQGGFHWRDEDDPFRWRNRLPFARAGLGELLILGGGSALLTAAVWFIFPLLAPLPALCCLGVLWFFRDPERNVPAAPETYVAPADGKVVSIERLDHDEWVEGPAVVIGIFLSIFNVHVNRSPAAARVLRLRYRPGKCLNALRPESARENEHMAVGFQELERPYRKMLVRQITGAIARRIVCWVAPGEELGRGERFGMIKLGSRTELVLPHEEGLCIDVRVGDRVKAGASILARYSTDEANDAS